MIKANMKFNASYYLVNLGGVGDYGSPAAALSKVFAGPERLQIGVMER